MSQRPLGITERQARTLLRAANRERGVVEVKIDGVTFRLIPEVLASKNDNEPKPVDQKPKGYL